MKKNLNDKERKSQYGTKTTLMNQFWKPEKGDMALYEKPKKKRKRKNKRG